MENQFLQLQIHPLLQRLVTEAKAKIAAHTTLWENLNLKMIIFICMLPNKDIGEAVSHQCSGIYQIPTWFERIL